MSQLYKDVIKLQNKKQDILTKFPDVCRDVVIQMEDAGLKRGASTLSELLFELDSIDQDTHNLLANTTSPSERKEFLIEMLEQLGKGKE